LLGKSTWNQSPDIVPIGVDVTVVGEVVAGFPVVDEYTGKLAKAVVIERSNKL
jgi:hypothetical protein